MPIKDLNKRREYQRQLMAKKRLGLTEKNVSPSKKILLDRKKNVRPCSRCQTEIAGWYHLIIAEQEKTKLLTKQLHQLEKALKAYEKQLKEYEKNQTMANFYQKASKRVISKRFISNSPR